MSDLHDITTLLDDLDAGRPGAMDDLMARVYGDLERVACNQLREQFGDRAGQITIEPAALVNESFLRLIEQRNRYDNRGHFFAVATKAMFRVLIDYARARHCVKRGGDHKRSAVDMGALEAADGTPEHDVVDLHEALEKLAAIEPKKAQTVELLYFGGLTAGEAAEHMEVSRKTIERKPQVPRALLGITKDQKLSRPAYRSITAPGFARAFFQANP